MCSASANSRWRDPVGTESDVNVNLVKNIHIRDVAGTGLIRASKRIILGSDTVTAVH